MADSRCVVLHAHPRSSGARGRRFLAACAGGSGPEFAHAIGFRFERICRLDRFTRMIDTGTDTPLAVLAVAAGCFDQAHLARDCVALTGRTPHQLRAVQMTASSKTVGQAER